MLERLFPQQSDDKLYVEDVMSVFLYTGNSSTQTITNGIDLAGKGGLVWLKARSSAQSNIVFDTNRGVENRLVTNADIPQSTLSGSLTAFNSNGFALGNFASTNDSGVTYASWTFRKAPKFFDIVTYTGNSANRTIAHNLGVAPGCVMIKRTDSNGNWGVYHRSNSNTEFLYLNTFAAVATSAAMWNSTTPTATEFTVGTDATVNASGGTYVAYLFAHDPSADGIIQCGTYQGSSSSPIVVNLGWEPQWLMVKNVTGLGGWVMADNMRGFSVTTDGAFRANGSDAEVQTDWCAPTATGFELTGSGIWTSGEINSGSSLTKYIYIAIRRGPMRTPTLGTSVFSPVLTSASTGTAITVGFPVDSHWANFLAGDGNNTSIIDRLRGLSSVSGTNSPNTWLATASTTSESGVAGPAAYLTGANNTGWVQGSYASSASSVRYNFRRAPGFMDVVCYTGNGSTSQTVNHNLGVEPELIILKCRNVSNDGGATNGSIWNVAVKAGSTAIHFAIVGSQGLNFNGASTWSEPWVNIFATATSFRPYYITGAFTTTPAGATSGNTYVAYLFASVPGVSKVGTYTGNGSSQTINCGFTNGARFILIKRTDSAGNWCVWDSARGIVTGDDPVLSLNNNFAQNNTTDDVDPHSTGFIVNSVSPGREINLNGSTYIYLAIA